MKNYFPNPRARVPYLQTNRSDDLGSLWSTKGLDFQTNLGTMRLSSKLVTNTTSVDDADLGTPTAFEFFNSVWWAVCGTRVFKNTDANATTAFAEDASTGAQTDYTVASSDLAVFNDRLWSTTNDNLYSKPSAAGDWTSRAALTTTTVHQMTNFVKFNRLYVVSSSTLIASIDTADVVASSGAYSLDITFTNQVISTINSNNDFVWVGTIPTTERTEGLILKWDGFSAQATESYSLKTNGILSILVYDNIPYAVDTEGRILKYTGYSFQEIARLPLVRTLLTNANLPVASSRFVHFNGFVATKNNTLLVLVNNLNSDTLDDINENLPSGIWELDLATNSFTHRYSFTLSSLASATVTDFGQNRISVAGAIKVNTFRNRVAGGRSYLLAGATVFTDSSSTRSAIYNDSPPFSANEGQKKGYFVTTWFYSQEVSDKWTRLWSTFRQLLSASDSIVYKYRTIEEAPVEATITWVNTTSFTTTTDITAYGPTATGFDGTTGGEVEGIQGTGAGACVHITNIVNNGGTYTVTVDEAVTGVTTGTAKARFQKWIKLNPVGTIGQVNQWAQYAIGPNNVGASNVRIQIKAVLSFTGDGEFWKFALFSNEDIKITA